MPYRLKPCGVDGCETTIRANNHSCWEHVNWRAVSKIPTSYGVTRICQVCGLSFNITHSVQKTCANCRHVRCAVCDLTFTRYGTEHRKTCSPECSAIFNAAPLLRCERCNREFKQRRGHKTKYCGDECRYIALRKDENTTAKIKRSGWQYRQWRNAVLKRDNRTCQKCGATSGLHAHHIKEWKDYPSLAYEVSNGLTVCFQCHSVIHNKPITKRGADRKSCSDCSASITGRGASSFCRSCSMRFSPKRVAATALRTRDESGRFAG